MTVSPAFAVKWLLPRVDRFQAAWPDMDVRLETSLKPVDFSVQDIDIGVRYGTGSWAGLTADKLMDEEVYPVCSPKLLGQGTLSRAEDLAEEVLIHDMSMEGHAGFPSWDAWLRRVGVTRAITTRGLKINNSAAVLQAAAEGQGIALARSVMARDDLASGRLVKLFPDISFPSALAYFVVYRAETSHFPRVIAFREWLLEEAAKWESSVAPIKL